MKLVLAEKPSVAQSLSKVLGADQRGDGYLEGNGYIVGWCVVSVIVRNRLNAYGFLQWRIRQSEKDLLI